VGSGFPFLLGLASAAALLVPVLLVLRAALGEARRHAASFEREAAELQEQAARIEDGQLFLTGFLKNFPHLAHELHGGLTERQLPDALLSVVEQSLEPQQAVVLVRRVRAGAERLPSLPMVVAAAGPEGCAIKRGTEVPVDHGELGYVAEVRRVVSRQDLDSEVVRSRVKPGPESPLGPADLIAPLDFEGETLGLVALWRPRRTSFEAKAALRLMAQTAARALHHAGQASRMKMTAEMDGLTRVFNKRQMEQTLAELVYRAACADHDRRGQGSGTTPAAVSALLIGLDDFEAYNDANGRRAGDHLLQELCRLVQQNIRKDDVFGRLGSEEFLLLLPDCGTPQAFAAAEKVRSVIAAHSFPGAGRQPLGLVSVSVGVAEYPHDGRDAASLLRAAGVALQEARRRGRNRIHATARLVEDEAALLSAPGGAVASS
jgi:diguanylate cyclase (GGDEF)-like protein